MATVTVEKRGDEHFAYLDGDQTRSVSAPEAAEAVGGLLVERAGEALGHGELTHEARHYLDALVLDALPPVPTELPEDLDSPGFPSDAEVGFVAMEGSLPKISVEWAE